MITIQSRLPRGIRTALPSFLPTGWRRSMRGPCLRSNLTGGAVGKVVAKLVTGEWNENQRSISPLLAGGAALPDGGAALDVTRSARQHLAMAKWIGMGMVACRCRTDFDSGQANSPSMASTIGRPWSIQDDVASQSYRIQIGAKVKPAPGKFEEHDLALRAGHRTSRFDALGRSRSAAA